MKQSFYLFVKLFAAYLTMGLLKAAYNNKKGEKESSVDRIEVK